jgi:phospholipid/cholesterol/gamma-HCH transport system ATP-binding protein
MMFEDRFQAVDMHLDDPASFPGIAVQGVGKFFGPKVVLDDCDLTIHKGETLVVIGRSGQGKSVLLKLIVRLLEPDAGRIWFEGREVTALPRAELMLLRRSFGMLFQGAALFDSMTVGENVGLALQEHTDWSDARIAARIGECLELVGLSGTEDKLPSALSGGMKKRAGLARAIVMQPHYILYDEPTTGLDPITADAINDLIIKLQIELNVTSIIVTHDMQSAIKVGDRVAMLNDGRIIFHGPMANLRQTDHQAVRQFIEGRAEGPLGVF